LLCGVKASTLLHPNSTAGNQIMKRWVLAFLSSVLINQSALAQTPEVTAAISLDIPPYVMENATKGLEVDIVRRALADHSLRFVQMPYGDLETAVQKGLADVSIAVRQSDQGVSYSDDFIAFENYAISKKRDSLKIDSIADLGDHQVLTWQGADLELGDTFRNLFSADAPKRANYVEVANQEDQVRLFWERDGSVAVIDRSIFVYFTKAMGHSMTEVTLHNLFPPVTDFRVGFKDPALRDTFNVRLTELCRSGEYQALLQRYDVVLQKSVCDTE
jgi:polar amino acid transport system substrate-binding protein